jgi:hypothetical protein
MLFIEIKEKIQGSKLSAIERVREENIKRNNEFLQSLGFNTAPIAQNNKRGICS